MRRNSIIIVIIALLVVGGAALALTNKTDDTPPATTPTQTTETTDTTNTETNTTDTNDTDQLAAATITYKDGSFSPSSVTIKTGQSVNIINDSDADIQFVSNPHPVHTDNAELNIGSIAIGSNKTITIVNTGTWGYHNHLNSTESGTIVVQ